MAEVHVGIVKQMKNKLKILETVPKVSFTQVQKIPHGTKTSPKKTRLSYSIN